METIDTQITLFNPDTYLWFMVAAMTAVSLVLFFVGRHTRRRWLRRLCLVLALAGWGVFFYGAFLGIRGVDVTQV